MRKLLTFIVALHVLAPGIAARRDIPDPSYSARFAGAKAPVLNVEGEMRHYITHGYWIHEGTAYYDEGIMANLCFSSDSKTVWLHNLMPAYQEGWLKGEIKEDNSIFFSSGQQVSSWGIGDVFIRASVKDPRADGMREIEGFSFTLNEDGSYTLADNGQEVYLEAYTHDGIVLETDFSVKLTPFTDSLPVPPEDGESKTFVRTYFDDVSKFPYEHVVNCVFKGNEAWLQGFSGHSPDAYVKAEIREDKSIFIPGGQYIGLSGAYVSYMYAGLTDGETGQTALIDGLLLTPAGQGYESNPANRLYFGPDMKHLEYCLKNYSLTPYELESLTPAKPVIIEVTEVVPEIYVPGHEIGDRYMTFSQPTESEDGQLLAPDHLFYEVVVNGKPYEFSSPLYPRVENPMALVPFDHADGLDFSYIGNTTVFLRMDNVNDIAVKSIYTAGDERKESMSDTYVIQSGIAESIVSCATVVATEYHDLCGRRVAAPATGIFLRTNRYSDGTTHTQKTIITKK